MGGFLSLARAAGFSLLGFVRTPAMAYDEGRDAVFEELLNHVLQNNLETIPFSLPYPKYEFLCHLSKSNKYLMHGSPRGDIKAFEPREQTTFYGTRVRAVFASADGIWSMFFAILDRTILMGFRNGCFSVDKRSAVRNRYYFSIPAGTLSRNPWVDGYVYILPKSGFDMSDTPNEWICAHSVVPITKLPVTRTDFPFLHHVTEFTPTDSILKFFLRNAIQSHLLKIRANRRNKNL